MGRTLTCFTQSHLIVVEGAEGVSVFNVALVSYYNPMADPYLAVLYTCVMDAADKTRDLSQI